MSAENDEPLGNLSSQESETMRLIKESQALRQFCERLRQKSLEVRLKSTELRNQRATTKYHAKTKE